MAYDKAIDSTALETGLTTLADAIRAKGGTSAPLEFPEGMADAVAAISGGGETENIFPATTKINFSPQQIYVGYEFPPKSVVYMDFTSSTQNPIRFWRSFQQATNIDKVVVSGTPASKNNIEAYFTFFKVSDLRTFDAEKANLVFTDFDSCFTGCLNLETVLLPKNGVNANIDISDAPLLSARSIESIINALVDLAGQSAKTLTLHPDIKSKLTTEQRTSITNKNWTLA